MRAVLDPNVVISGLISAKGRPAQILRAWQEGDFELVASPLLLAELGRALAYPRLRARIAAADAAAAIQWLRGGVTILDDPTDPGPIRSEDPDDDYLVALASEQRAALVSGDKHLLDLSDRIPVYSPGEFLDLIRSRRQ